MPNPVPPVLLVEDRDSLRIALRDTMRAEGYEVVEASDGRAALEALRRGRFLAVVTDLRMPGADGHDVLSAAREADADLPVIVMTAYGTVEDAVRAMKAGAFDFVSKPVEPDHLLVLLSRARERRRLLTENLVLRAELGDRRGAPRIVGDSPALQEVSRQVRKVAPTDATVLLEGESGTGKELFARAIHHLSARRDAPFVALNCAAIPEPLLENELFGHEKGAYTGAVGARAGKLELADGGTLFLDEVGELGAGVQAKLLRVLQERTFERVGGNRTVRVDLRVVAATNRELRAAVARRTFREDLYFRIAVVTLRIPALRERPGDIRALAEHFLGRYRRELGRDGLKLGDAALTLLERHVWPGNVRELQNAIERAAILAEGDVLGPGHFPLGAPDSAVDAEARLAALIGLDGTLDEVAARARVVAERLKIGEALAAAGGNKARAAEALGVSYKRLLNRIRELECGEPGSP